MTVFITYRNGKTDTLTRVETVENTIGMNGEIKGLLIVTAQGVHGRPFKADNFVPSPHDVIDFKIQG